MPGKAGKRRHGPVASLAPRSPRSPFFEGGRHRRLCHGPHQVFPGHAKVVRSKCPRSLCGSPGGGGAVPGAQRGRGAGLALESRAEASRAEPSRAAPSRASRPAAGTAAEALSPASPQFQRKFVFVFGERFSGVSH